jgi:putative acyl-CoA dehydrogenase
MAMTEKQGGRAARRRAQRLSPPAPQGQVGQPLQRLDAFAQRLRDELADLEAIESRARRVVERMALALQGSLLVRHAPPAVADAFCASRLAGDGGLSYGTLPPGVDARAIVERHLPPV